MEAAVNIMCPLPRVSVSCAATPSPTCRQEPGEMADKVGLRLAGVVIMIMILVLTSWFNLAFKFLNLELYRIRTRHFYGPTLRLSKSNLTTPLLQKQFLRAGKIVFLGTDAVLALNFHN
jgi:hypothetical protein